MASNEYVLPCRDDVVMVTVYGFALTSKNTKIVTFQHTIYTAVYIMFGYDMYHLTVLSSHSIFIWCHSIVYPYLCSIIMGL